MDDSGINMLEPADGSRYVIETRRGGMYLIHRDDAHARRWPFAPNQRWYAWDAEIPSSWDEIITEAVSIQSLLPVATVDSGPTDVHTYFGLTYSNYLVLHRTLMQSMPEAWHHQFTALLRQLDQAFAHVEKADVYQVLPATECEVGDLNATDMVALGITRDDGDDEDPNGETVYHDRDGNELESWHRILVPTGRPDPVPHYNRGRTHIEPRLDGQET